MRVSYLIPALVFTSFLAVFPPSISSSQDTPAELVGRRWPAHWITCPDSPRREFGVFHFRRSFSLAAVPERFVLHVSADSRYELFVNGARVLRGPARGDLNHWRYETQDVARYFRRGKNTLAAVVWNFAEHAPMAQMTNETGFIVQGEGATESLVNSDARWKCLADRAIQMIPLDRDKVPFYTVVGPGEQVEGAKYPWGWETTHYDDSAWKPAVELTPGGPRGIQDSPSRWMLVPRTIPLLEEKIERLGRIVRAESVQPSSDFLEGRVRIMIPSSTKASILFDQTHLTTSYPELVVSGGRGAEITLTYAEALWKGREKGNRNETEGKEIIGYQDRFLPDGGQHRLFRPLWWRTFRYLQVDVQTAKEPLVLEDLRGVFTAYPFVARARFESDDPMLAKMWEIGWRTARLCAHETYMDCPYYEQLQYVGDTRIQALVSLYMTGDDRLVKNAIELMDESRTPEGLTQSRYPSSLPQYIPPFSLFWIGMLHDFWWYRGEGEFVRGYLPGMRNVLDWFESRLAPSGLLGNLEWWNFVDWTKDFADGVPPQEADGQSAILSLQFAAALREAADLEAALGRPEHAARNRALAARIRDAVRKSCWDASRQLLADTPARRHFSQHANILGVLEDAIPPGDQLAVMRTVLSDSRLTQCSYYFRYYLFRAMKKVGLADQYLEQLGPWREMLQLGLTTWAETPEPTRSDCHAWSAHPNFDLLATVAGIEPAAAGFGQVLLQPHLGHLTRLQATLPHPAGEIRVRYQRQGEGLIAEVFLPETVSGWFFWGGKKLPLRPGSQQLTIQP